MQSWNQWGVAGGAYNYQTAPSTLGSDLQGYPSSNYQYYSTAGGQDPVQAQHQWQQWTQWQQQFQQWQQQYGEKYQQAVGGMPGPAPLPPSATTQNGQTPAAAFNPSVQPPLPPLPPLEKVVNPPLPAEPPLPTSQPPPLPSSQAPTPAAQTPINMQPSPGQLPLTQQPPPLMSQPPPPPPSMQPHGLPPPGYSQGQMYQGSHGSYFSGSYDNSGAPESSQSDYYSRQEDSYPPMNQYQGPPYSAGHGEGYGSNSAGRKRPIVSGDGPFENINDFGGKKMRMDVPPLMDKRIEGEEGWNHWNKDGGRGEKLQDSHSGEKEKQDSSGKPIEMPADDELSEAEKSFDAQFEQWEAQFMRWKEQNKNHSDKNQYREYEAKWESWREQLLQRREQMKKKRENGKNLLPSNEILRSPFPKNLPPVIERSPEGHQGEGRWSSSVEGPSCQPSSCPKEEKSSLSSENGIPGLDLVVEKNSVNEQDDMRMKGDGSRDNPKEGNWDVVKDKDERQDPWFRREDKSGAFTHRNMEKTPLLPTPSDRSEEGKKPQLNVKQNERGMFNEHGKPLHHGRPDTEEGKNIWQNQQLRGPHGVFGQSPAHGELDSDMRTENNKMWKGEPSNLFLPPPDLHHRHTERDIREDDEKQWQPDVFGGISAEGRPTDCDMRGGNERIWPNPLRGPRDQFGIPDVCPQSGRQVDSDMRDEPSGPWSNLERGPIDMYGPSDKRQGIGRIDIRNDLNKPWHGRDPPEIFTSGMRGGNDGPQPQNFKPGPQGMSKPPPFVDTSRFPPGDMRHPMMSDPKHPHNEYDHEDTKDVYPRGRGEWGSGESYNRSQWRDEPPRNKRFEGSSREIWDDYRGPNRPLMDVHFDRDDRPFMDGDRNDGQGEGSHPEGRPYNERYMIGGQQERWEGHGIDPQSVWEEPVQRSSSPPPERKWPTDFVAPTVVDYGHMPRKDPQNQPAPRIPSPRIPTPTRDFSGNVQTFDYCHGASRNPLPFAVDSVQREQWRGNEYGDRSGREVEKIWDHDERSPSKGRTLDPPGREIQRRESRWEKPRWSNPKHSEGDPPRWDEEERFSSGSDRWSGNQSRKDRERERDRERDKERDRDRWRKGRPRGEEERGSNFRGSNSHESDKDKDRSSRHKKEESGSRNGSSSNGGGSSSSHPLVSYPLPSSTTPPPPFISQPLAKVETILIEDLLVPPGRANRPPRIVIILRGPPGSGKTFVAKLVKDKEVEQGGSAPRILSLDDYFMVELEKEEKDPETGRKVTKKCMMYEYEAKMEKQYRNSLVKAFRKTVDDGYFPFIIVDCVNDKVRQFDEMWTYAKQKGFQVYICEMDMDVPTCSKRNTHGRTQRDIEEMVKHWEETPRSYVRVDVRSLLQSAAITEVEMEDTTEEKEKVEEKTSEKDDDLEKGDAEEDAEKNVVRSKWDGMEASEEKLDRLDGLARKRKSENHPQTLEDWLQLTDDYGKRKCTPGKKQVRWADLEERRQQERMRAIGFVVGQTDWSRMTDPTFGEGALTQTKYI